jgi:hypothetical protein
MNSWRCLHIYGLVVWALFGLTGCSDDTGEDLLRSKEQMLVGTWDLEAAEEIREGDLEFSYTFAADGTVRNRIGGAFLAELRDIEAVREAVEGEPLADLSRLDGGNINWVGSWSLTGDSLTVLHDLLIVEVFGDVPILGKVTLPVFNEELAPEAQRVLQLTCQMEGDLLTLRGESLTAWQGTTGVDGPAAEAVDLVLQEIDGQIVAAGLSTYRFVRR